MTTLLDLIMGVYGAETHGMYAPSMVEMRAEDYSAMFGSKLGLIDVTKPGTVTFLRGIPVTFTDTLEPGSARITISDWSGGAPNPVHTVVVGGREGR